MPDSFFKESIELSVRAPIDFVGLVEYLSRLQTIGFDIEVWIVQNIKTIVFKVGQSECKIQRGVEIAHHNVILMNFFLVEDTFDSREFSLSERVDLISPKNELLSNNGGTDDSH